MGSCCRSFVLQGPLQFQVQLMNVQTEKYVTADTTDPKPLVYCRLGGEPSNNQAFNLRKVSETLYVFELNGTFVGPAPSGTNNYLQASFKSVALGQTFQISTHPTLPVETMIRASFNGMLVQVNKDNLELLSADLPFPPTNLSYIDRWDTDAGIFAMRFIPYQKPGTADCALPHVKRLDGLKVQLKSAFLKKYLRTQSEDGDPQSHREIAANSSDGSQAETFKLWAIPNTEKFLLHASSTNWIVGLDDGLLATLQGGRKDPLLPGVAQTFEIFQKTDDFTRVRIKASNGRFLEAKNENRIIATRVELTPDAAKWNEWADNDPSVFMLNIVGVGVHNNVSSMYVDIAAEDIQASAPATKPLPANMYQFELLSIVEQWDFHIDYTFNWLRAKKGGAAYRKRFNLRKISKNLFAFEFQGCFIGPVLFDHKLSLLRASFRPVEKEETFEIITHPTFPDRVHIKASNGCLVQLRKETTDVAIRMASNDLAFTNQWDNQNAIFIMTMIPNPKEGIASALNNIKRLDGVKIQLMSVVSKKLFCTKTDGGIAANKSDTCGSDVYKLWAVPNTDKFLFESFDGQFLGLNGEVLVENFACPGKFEIVQKEDDFSRIRIKTSNGCYLEAKNEEYVSATAQESAIEWGESDPSVFSLCIIGATFEQSDTATRVIERAGQNANDTVG